MKKDRDGRTDNVGMFDHRGGYSHAQNTVFSFAQQATQPDGAYTEVPQLLVFG